MPKQEPRMGHIPEELIEEIRSTLLSDVEGWGDGDHWIELHLQFVAICRRQKLSREDAEDAAQEAIIGLRQAFHSARKRKVDAATAAEIAKNKAIDLLRKNLAHSKNQCGLCSYVVGSNFSEVDPTLLVPAPRTSVNDPEVALETQEHTRRIQELIQILEEICGALRGKNREQVEIFLLNKRDGLKYSEIAIARSRNPGTIKAEGNRGKRILAEEFSKRGIKSPY